MQNGANATAPAPPAAPAPDRRLPLLFSVLAAIHVFLFSAAFPLINNVDEQEHFDLVIKYSHGHIPRTMELPARETMQYLVVYDSQEYVAPPGETIRPPPWKQPDTVADLQAWEQKLWPGPNYESSQPPLYYLVGSAWWHLGQWLGLDGGQRMYWLRFLNVVIVASLVWLGWATARWVFPGNRFVPIAVPVLVAFMPQTAFYSINNDILSPLCFGLAFLALARFWRADIPSAWLGFSAGLFLALTWLTKISNLPLLVVATAFVSLKIAFVFRTGKLKAALPSILLLLFSAALPIAAWMVRTKQAFGDVTGSAAKIRFLTWTLKPFGDWWHHPIFTPHGAWTFLSELLGNFWQGEFWWHHQPMTWPTANVVYTLLTITLVVIAAFSLWRPGKAIEPDRAILWFALAALVAAVGFLATLSVTYDFHDCPNPSRAHPYFNQARLILGALVPFLLLVSFGMDRMLARFGNRGKFFALVALVLCMVSLEVATDFPALFNEYNWFHL